MSLAGSSTSGGVAIVTMILRMSWSDRRRPRVAESSVSMSARLMITLRVTSSRAPVCGCVPPASIPKLRQVAQRRRAAHRSSQRPLAGASPATIPKPQQAPSPAASFRKASPPRSLRPPQRPLAGAFRRPVFAGAVSLSLSLSPPASLSLRRLGRPSAAERGSAPSLPPWGASSRAGTKKGARSVSGRRRGRLPTFPLSQYHRRGKV